MPFTCVSCSRVRWMLNPGKRRYCSRACADAQRDRYGAAQLRLATLAARAAAEDAAITRHLAAITAARKARERVVGRTFTLEPWQQVTGARAQDQDGAECVS